MTADDNLLMKNNIGMNNNSVSNRHQTITWDDDGTIFRPIYALVG